MRDHAGEHDAAERGQRDREAVIAAHRAAAIRPPRPGCTRRVHVDRDDARDALLLHRHADQLLGHLHRDLVVADEQELRLPATSR